MTQLRLQTEIDHSNLGDRIQKAGIDSLRILAVAAGGLVLTTLDQLATPKLTDEDGVDLFARYTEE